MVRPVVPELQLIRLQSQRESDDLMTEADSEDGPLAEQRPYCLDRVGNPFRVARTVGQENPVGIQRQRGAGRGRGWYDCDLETFIHQAPQDIVLDPKVIGHDFETAIRPSRTHLTGVGPVW